MRSRPRSRDRGGLPVPRWFYSSSSSLVLSLGHNRFGSEDPLLFPPLGVLDVLGLFLHLLVLHVDSQSTKVRLELALLLELCDDGMSASGFTHDDDLGKLVSIEQSPKERYQSLGILTLVDLDDERR